MPAKRTRLKAQRRHISEADTAAFLAGDGLALHRALGLRPWEFAWPAILDEAEAKGWSPQQLMAWGAEIEAELLAFDRS